MSTSAISLWDIHMTASPVGLSNHETVPYRKCFLIITAIVFLYKVSTTKANMDVSRLTPFVFCPCCSMFWSLPQAL